MAIKSAICQQLSQTDSILRPELPATACAAALAGDPPEELATDLAKAVACDWLPRQPCTALEEATADAKALEAAPPEACARDCASADTADKIHQHTCPRLEINILSHRWAALCRGDKKSLDYVTRVALNMEAPFMHAQLRGCKQCS
jgi:hypothetical protein